MLVCNCLELKFIEHPEFSNLTLNYILAEKHSNTHKNKLDIIALRIILLTSFILFYFFSPKTFQVMLFFFSALPASEAVFSLC